MTELERSSLLLGPSARGADERGFESLPRPAHSERAGLTVMQGMPLRSLQPIQTDRTSLDSTPHLQLSICSPPPRCSSALIWGQFNKHPGAASVLLLFYISFNILQPQTPNASPASLALHVAISGGSSLRAGALGEKVAQGLFFFKSGYYFCFLNSSLSLWKLNHKFYFHNGRCERWMQYQGVMSISSTEPVRNYPRR